MKHQKDGEISPSFFIFSLQSGKNGGMITLYMIWRDTLCWTLSELPALCLL